jgi:hypothetical protein
MTPMPLFDPASDPTIKDSLTVAASPFDLSNVYRVITPSHGLFGTEKDSQRKPHYLVEMLDRSVHLFFLHDGTTKRVLHINGAAIDASIAHDVWRVVTR